MKYRLISLQQKVLLLIKFSYVFPYVVHIFMLIYTVRKVRMDRGIFTTSSDTIGDTTEGFFSNIDTFVNSKNCIDITLLCQL